MVLVPHDMSCIDLDQPCARQTWPLSSAPETNGPITGPAGVEGIMKYLGRIVAVCAATAVVAAAVVAPPFAEADTPARVLEITSPLAPMLPSGPLTVRGTLGSGSSGGTVVLFAVDVSGSTSSPSQDCSGDGTRNTTDDFNADGSQGDVLDCEIAAVISMVASLAGRGDVKAGLIPFGSSASAADVSSDDGDQQLVAPGYDGPDGTEGTFGGEGDRDRIPDIINTATSLTRGRVGLFAPRSVGTGTSFTAPLSVAENIFAAEVSRRASEGDTKPFNQVVLFLSDGQASITSTDPTVTALSSRAAVVNTYAIGAGSGGCGAPNPLRTISGALTGTCTSVQDPSTLTAAIGATVVSNVEVTLENVHTGVVLDVVTASTSALGEWAASFAAVPAGRYKATARSEGLEASRSFSVRTVGGSISYAALGDSYSAGEGQSPWRNDNSVSSPTVDVYDGACHRSTEGYPMQVKFPGANTALAFSSGSKTLFGFPACSGAITQNILYNKQEAENEAIPLQIGFLNDTTDLITATIGGNDVEFSQIAMHCVTQLDCQQRSGRGSDGFATLNSNKTLTLPEYVDLRLAILAAQLPPTYARMKAATSHRATVVIAGYPELFQLKPSVFCATRTVISREEREYLSKSAHRFNSLVGAATSRSGVFYSPVIEDFSPHLPCGDGEVWLGGIATGASDKGQKLHPTEAGYKAYANIINDDLNGWASNPPRGLKPTGLPFNPEPTAPANLPTLRQFSAAAAESTPDWVDESLDALPPFDSAALGGVETDGLAVNEDGTVAFDPWIAENLPDLPEVTVEELRSVATAREPLLQATNVTDTTCVDTAAAGQKVTLTAEGFAPGTQVTLSSGTADSESSDIGTSTADASGSVKFAATVPDTGTVPATFAATGPTPAMASTRAVTVINVPISDTCLASTTGGSTSPKPAPASPGDKTGPEDSGAAPTDSQANPTAAPSGVAGTSTDDGSANRLAFTGSSLFWALAAAVALSVGFGLVLVTRRTSRRQPV